MTDKAGPDGASGLPGRIPGCADVEPVRSGLPRTYRCRREGTGEPVTALVYPVRVDSGTATEFTRQVQALGGVDHPRVAPVLDAGLADGLPYVLSTPDLTTPDAGTLSELINQRLLAPAEVAELGRDLASGLAAIHAAGLVHGGVTPDTVVVTPGRGYLLSGLTLGLEQHTGHTALSSPRQLYLAPETLRDGTTTPMSDLYALGTVLHAAASGRPPLAARMGETAGDHILRVLHEPPGRLEMLPDRLADLVSGLLEKDPARRPRDAGSVTEALAGLAPEPSGSAAGSGSLPLVRPVIRTVRPVADPPAPSTTSSASPGPVPAGSTESPGTRADGTSGAAGVMGSDDAPAATEQPAEPALPRPALMNRVRSPSVRPEPPSDQPASTGEPAADRPSQPTIAGASSPGETIPRATAPRAANSRSESSDSVPESPRGEPLSPEPAALQPPAHEPAAPEPPDSGSPERDPEPRTEPGPRRRRTWLLASGGLAVAVALIAVLAFASRQDQDPTTGPEPVHAGQRSPDPTTPAPKPALDVRLNPPVDHDTYVELSWTGDPGLEYAVVIAQVGKPNDLKLVYDRTKHRVPVVPGVKYCFAIQATDGIQTFETEPWPIRDAECEL